MRTATPKKPSHQVMYNLEIFFFFYSARAPPSAGPLLSPSVRQSRSLSLSLALLLPSSWSPKEPPLGACSVELVSRSLISLSRRARPLCSRSLGPQPWHGLPKGRARSRLLLRMNSGCYKVLQGPFTLKRSDPGFVRRVAAAVTGCRLLHTSRST